MADRLPVLRPAEVIRALERGGYMRERQRAHLIMRNPATGRSVPIPIHAGDLKQHLIKQAGLTRAEFLRLLRG